MYAYHSEHRGCNMTDPAPGSRAREQARHFVEQLHAFPLRGAPPAERLQAIADRLRLLAGSPAWRTAPYREATAGEELEYELAVSDANGPSLYLVSDGAGVVSPPHHHDTWTVIAGIRGRELNHLYVVRSAESRIVVRDALVEVGPGAVVTLGDKDIHSTEVLGVDATFHLHLYGTPLHALPVFRSRCYTIADETRSS